MNSQHQPFTWDIASSRTRPCHSLEYYFEMNLQIFKYDMGRTDAHTGKIVSSPDHGNFDFQQIPVPWKCPKGWKLTSNKFPYHGSVQKGGSWLPTNSHTMEVSKRVEVDFQQIPIPWKCPKGWKLTSNKFPYHGSVQKGGSWLPTNSHTMEVSKRVEVSWKFVGSRNDFHDLERTAIFQCQTFGIGMGIERYIPFG